MEARSHSMLNIMIGYLLHVYISENYQITQFPFKILHCKNHGNCCIKCSILQTQEDITLQVVALPHSHTYLGSHTLTYFALESLNAQFQLLYTYMAVQLHIILNYNITNIHVIIVCATCKGVTGHAWYHMKLFSTSFDCSLIFFIPRHKTITDKLHIILLNIKTCGSESPGQEEAACMHIFRPT